ncbi:hypothetical protein Dimus_037191, partial [Dionaea muscipula]
MCLDIADHKADRSNLDIHVFRRTLHTGDDYAQEDPKRETEDDLIDEAFARIVQHSRDKND